MSGRRIGVRALIGVVLLWTLVPLLWMLLSSFKPSSSLAATTPEFTFTPTLEHYRALFSGGNDIGSYAVNSILTAGISTIIAVGARVARRLRARAERSSAARTTWRSGSSRPAWRRSPPPCCRCSSSSGRLGLLGTTPGLVVAYLSFNLPFAIWIMNAFFADLPPSLEEAAMVDGATHWVAFRRIALPLVLPGIATTAILCLVFSWNDYAFASTFSGPDSQTLPMAASQLVTQTEIDWGQLTAIGTIVVAPMILVGLVVRKWLVTGLTLGAVTGE